MNATEFWNTNNVSTFQGYDVTNGEVQLSDSEFEDTLDGLYEPITVLGMSYNPGATLSAVDPVAFRCAKGDHESYLQGELEDQLAREDSDGIEFIDGDEHELYE